MDKNPFYKPSGNIKDTNRTYVPNLYREVTAEMQAEEFSMQVADTKSEHIIRLQDRPVIGVLYSISAGIEGELFPVYVGRNTIGSDLSCDICLRETSVSAQHGILLARKLTNEDGCEYISVTLSDSNSSYGTGVNGEKLSFEKVTCLDGDVISLGRNYVLVLSLFNALGKLSVAFEFDRIPEPKNNSEDTVESLPHKIPTINPLPTNASDISETKAVPPVVEEASVDFYKPTKKQGQDHYNNETIIL